MPSWAQWPSPLQSKLEDLALKFQATEIPSLHGKTDNNEFCKCMPGSLEPPLPSKLEQAALEAARSGHTRKDLFLKEVEGMTIVINPKLAELKKEMKLTDEALAKMQESKTKVENAATKLKEAFHQVKEAHAQGGCDVIAQRIKASKKQGKTKEGSLQAALDDIQPLTCENDIVKAAGELEERVEAAQRTCPMGVATLQPLQTMAAPTPELVALIPRISSPSIQSTMETEGEGRSAFRQLFSSSLRSCREECDSRSSQRTRRCDGLLFL